MRQDFNAEQWAQFVRETDGHLDNVRQILLSGQGGCIGGERLECLARSFHSIQWLSGSMGALAMEMLASCAEAFLAQTDEEAATLAKQLMDAVDGLQMLRDNEGSDQGVALLPSARRQGILDDPVWQMPDDEFRIGAEFEAGCEASNDDVDFSGFFMELMRDNIPSLTVLASPECEARDDCGGCGGCTSMSTSVESLRYAADAIGYAKIKCALDEIRVHLPDCGTPATPAQRARIVEKLPGLLALIELECAAHRW